MDNLELYKLMRQIILTVTGCSVVIKSNQNKDAPDGEYCAVLTTGVKRQRGQAIIRTSNSDIVTSPIGDVVDTIHDIRAQVIAEISCNFYRGNANDYAHQLFQANKRPDIQELLFINKVGWNGTNPLNNLTALQSEDWEDRAQIVVRLTYEQSQTVTTNAIYQIPLEVEEFDSGEIITDSIIKSPNP